MHSLNSAYLDGLRFSVKDLNTLRRIGEHRGRQVVAQRQTRDTLKALQDQATIESSESSNRLDGIRAPRDRIERLVRHDGRPRGPQEREIIGYRDALRMIHAPSINLPFTPDGVLRLDRALCSHCSKPGGLWKTTDNEIVETDPHTGTWRVRFKTVQAAAVPRAMADLTAEFERAVSRSGAEPLVLVPLTVLDFLCIHPFTVSNGRISRLIAVQLLYQCGYEVGKYISLERIFEETKEDYFANLKASFQNWHEGTHVTMAWMRYFWSVLLRAHGEFAARVGNMGRYRGAKSAFVRKRALSRPDPFRLSELERSCPGVSRELVKQVLRQLKSEGKLIVEGRGAGARWCLGSGEGRKLQP